VFSWKRCVNYGEGAADVFSRHVNEFDDGVVKFFIVVKLEVGFDAFVASVPNVNCPADPVAADVFDVWVSHERVDFSEANQVTLRMVEDFVPRDIGEPAEADAVLVNDFFGCFGEEFAWVGNFFFRRFDFRQKHFEDAVVDASFERVKLKFVEYVFVFSGSWVLNYCYMREGFVEWVSFEHF